MSQSGNSAPKVDLNEVLSGINKASKQIHKDKNGVAYTSVYTSELSKWSASVQSALMSAREGTAIKGDLAKVQGQLENLRTAATAKDSKIAELTTKVEAAERLWDKQGDKHDQAVAKLRADIEKAQADRKELEKDLSSTTKALKDAEVAMKKPASKFDPDAAKAIQKEAEALRGDAALARSELGKIRVQESESKAQLDKAYKLNASLKRDVEDAKAEMANFKRQLAASRIDNVDLFNKDDLSMDDLKLAFGEKGLEKLMQVVATPSFDVRGRIQRLTGFFTVVAKGINPSLKAMVEILNKAFVTIKGSSSTWTVVLAPWVNSILKDLVLLDFKPIKTYRLDLEARISSVRTLPSSATFAEKANAAPPRKGEKPWRRVLNERKSRLTALVSSFNAKARSSVAYIRSIVASAAGATWGPFKGPVKKALTIVRAGASKTRKFFARMAKNTRLFFKARVFSFRFSRPEKSESHVEWDAEEEIKFIDAEAVKENEEKE